MPPTVAIFTRWPEPGRTKTRLIPALGAQGAAALHRRLLAHTIAVAGASGLPLELRVTGAPPDRFAAAFDWSHPVVEQGEGDLGARLARVPAPCLLIGCDCPDLAPRHLIAAAAALDRAPAVLGPAGDGGYWLLGLATPMPHLFSSMPWGTAQIAARTADRLARGGTAPVILETLDDCDRPEDLARWPHLTA